MKHRVVGIIIKDRKILLMRRIKNDQEYFVFPGGGVEENESLEEALRREMKEELSIDIENPKLIFELENQFGDQYGGQMKGYPNEHYYLIKSFSGKPELGGPEKERINNQNQYIVEWVKLLQISTMDNLYPQQAVTKLMELLRTQK